MSPNKKIMRKEKEAKLGALNIMRPIFALWISLWMTRLVYDKKEVQSVPRLLFREVFRDVLFKDDTLHILIYFMKPTTVAHRFIPPLLLVSYSLLGLDTHALNMTTAQKTIKEICRKPSAHWVGDGFHVFPGTLYDVSTVWCNAITLRMTIDDVHIRKLIYF